MKIAPNLESWTLFLILVVPGLISMHVYRLLFAAREIDWKGGLVQALFYSSLNLAVCLPILVPIHRDDFIEKHPCWYTAGLMVVQLVLPPVWPFLYRRVIKWQWLASKIQLPYPTAWDFFFDRREPAFVMVIRHGEIALCHLSADKMPVRRRGQTLRQQGVATNDDNRPALL